MDNDIIKGVCLPLLSALTTTDVMLNRPTLSLFCPSAGTFAPGSTCAHMLLGHCIFCCMNIYVSHRE